MTYSVSSEKITSFTQLRTWQAARSLATDIYKLTESFPSNEQFGLTSQVRRSAVSVTANIAEGFARGSASEKKHFYTIALGSLTETLSHMYISCDLGYTTEDKLQLVEKQAEDINKMTNGLMKSAEGRKA